ncbi:MAG TPA: hypothetical protein VNM91_11810 [Dehalococcoidia bacterium]|nr:hypothetical protein [Dehalococcoidia bacterium]
MTTTADGRPIPYTETIASLAPEALKHRRPVTHGWYMRGRMVNGEWQPEPGLPSDVLVYLDMGDPYVREAYPEKGYLPLSVVRNKKAVANVSPKFEIEPPDYETLDRAMEKLRAVRPQAVAAIEALIAECEQRMADGGLPRGEPGQYREKIRILRQRLEMLSDDSRFETLPLYEQMVNERIAVLDSLRDPGALRIAALEKERDAWQEHLTEVRRSKASASSPVSSGPSTRRRTESGGSSASPSTPTS